MPTTAPDMSVRALSRRMVPAAVLTAGLIRLLYRSLRVRIEYASGEEADLSGIWCFWHNRALLVPALYRALRPRHRAIVLTSASRDGSFLARVAASFRLEAARGSSSRRGGPALKALVRALREGADAGVTPDGPRGPRYVVQPGVIVAAALAQRPIVPLHLDFEACWRLRSWDRFIIPKPFSKARARFGAPMPPPAADAPAIEDARTALQDAMRASLHPE